MKTLSELWTNRFRYFLKEIGKYGRLIFNDHFSVILFVLLGFMMFFYREQLIHLQALNQERARLPIALVSAILLGGFSMIGRPLWLMKEADKSYIYARGEEWGSYWLKGTLAGLIMPLILNALIVFLLYPFISTVFQLVPNYVGLLCLIQLLFVIGLKFNQFLMIQKKSVADNWVLSLTYSVILFLGLMTFPIQMMWGLFILIMFGLALLVVRFKQVSGEWFDFEWVVEMDLQRQSIFYKWIGFFADVPQQTVTIKRRGMFDAMIESMTGRNQDVNHYLYLRLLFRNSAYSGIWFRVMVFFAILIILSPNVYIILGLGLIAYYLTIVQIIPMTRLYETNPFKRIYPKKVNPRKAVQNIFLIIMLIQWLAFSLSALWQLSLSTEWLLCIVLLFIGMFILSRVYVAFWLKKKIS